MYAAGVLAKTAKGYFKTVEEQVILLQSNEIGIFRTIAEWYLLFFAKFRGHRVRIEKVMTETFSQQNALVLITESPWVDEMEYHQHL